MQGESSRAPGPAHGAAPPGDLGRGGHGSGAPQLDEEPTPDAPRGGRYFFSCTSHLTLKLNNYVHAHIFFFYHCVLVTGPAPTWIQAPPSKTGAHG